MADTTTRAGKPAAPARKGGEFLGQPTWIWAVGAGAILLGYLYIRSKSSTSGQGTGSGAPRQGGGPTGWTTDTFKIWVRDHHGQPGPGPKPKPKPKGDGND